MSRIDELLKNEKVEWKKLGEVCTDKFWIMPATPDFTQEGIPYITGKNIRDGIIDFKNVKFISETDFENISKKRKILRDDILISMIGTIGEIGFVRDVIDFYGQNLYLIRLNQDIILNRFFYHYFSQTKIKQSLISRKNSSSQGYIRAGQLESLEVPIPSLEVQEEIVKILDNFTEYVTELQAELQAELQNRTKQYEYYRDDLLSEDSLKKLSDKLDSLENKEYDLESLKLEDIVKIKNGKDWKKLDKGKIPVYGSGGYMDVNVDKFSYNKPSVLIPRKGSIENVFYLDKAFWNVDTIFYTEIDESKIIPKYFYYFMKTVDLNALSTNTTRPSLTQAILNKIKINLPPLEVQSKVVEVLDKFQDLLSETQGLLPKEIEERQKQYEYYREKLLTFSKDVVRIESNRIESNRIESNNNF